MNQIVFAILLAATVTACGQGDAPPPARLEAPHNVRVVVPVRPTIQTPAPLPPPVRGTRPAAAPAEVFGPENAAVVVESYSDFECPFCGEQERKNGAAIAALLHARPTIRFEFYDLALPSHANAPVAAAAARCAAEAGTPYAVVRDRLFQMQDAWIGGDEVVDRLVKVLAPLAGGDTQLRACIEAPTNEARYALDMNLRRAIAVGIDGTPTLVVRGPRGQRLLTGIVSARQLASTLAEVGGL